MTMTSITRNVVTPAGALEYVLSSVLTAAVDSPMCYAMKAAGANDIVDFMSLTKPDLISLSWCTGTGADGVTSQLTIADCNKLMAVLDWFQSQSNRTLDTWFTLNADSFQQYRLNKVSNGSMIATVVPTADVPMVAMTAVLVSDDDAIVAPIIKHCVPKYDLIDDTAAVVDIADVVDSMPVPAVNVRDADSKTYGELNPDDVLTEFNVEFLLHDMHKLMLMFPMFPELTEDAVPPDLAELLDFLFLDGDDDPPKCIMMFLPCLILVVQSLLLGKRGVSNCDHFEVLPSRSDIVSI